MGDLTKNLSVYEFACKCELPGCHHKRVAHMPLVNAIQDAVDYFARDYTQRVKVVITGPNRCPEHNFNVQIDAGKSVAEAKASKSTHMDCIAADHTLFRKESDGGWVMIDPREVFDYYDDKHPDSYGLGLYSNRVHVDTREIRARW